MYAGADGRAGQRKAVSIPEVFRPVYHIPFFRYLFQKTVRSPIPPEVGPNVSACFQAQRQKVPVSGKFVVTQGDDRKLKRIVGDFLHQGTGGDSGHSGTEKDGKAEIFQRLAQQPSVAGQP